MKRPLVLALAFALAAPVAAAEAPPPAGVEGPLFTPSPKPGRTRLRLGYKDGTPAGPGGAKGSVGVGVGMKEGKPLQMMLWGGAGAAVGTVAGPIGVVLGAAAGSLIGLGVSLFATPKPEPAPPKPS